MSDIENELLLLLPVRFHLCRLGATAPTSASQPSCLLQLSFLPLPGWHRKNKSHVIKLKARATCCCFPGEPYGRRRVLFAMARACWQLLLLLLLQYICHLPLFLPAQLQAAGFGCISSPCPLFWANVFLTFRHSPFAPCECVGVPFNGLLVLPVASSLSPSGRSISWFPWPPYRNIHLAILNQNVGCSFHSECLCLRWSHKSWQRVYLFECPVVIRFLLQGIPWSASQKGRPTLHSSNNQRKANDSNINRKCTNKKPKLKLKLFCA